MATIKVEQGVNEEIDDFKTFPRCKDEEENDELQQDDLLSEAESGCATQVEVLALRSQVAYLQDMIEDLRKQLESVVHVLDESEFDNKEDDECSSIAEEELLERALQAKKFKTEESNPDLSSTELMSVDPLPVQTGHLKRDTKPDLLTSEEIDEIYEILNLRRSKAKLGKVERTQCEDVIRSISRATKLDQSSVCKIISQFGKLTAREKSDKSSMDMKSSEMFLLDSLDPLDALLENLPDLATLPPLQLSDSFIDKIEVPQLPAQKVGAT